MNTKKRADQAKVLVYIWFIVLVYTPAWAQDTRPNTYVGSDVCIECHEEEYEKYSKYARKSRSFQSVLKMKKGLTPDEVKECYACHTTGYGKPGGFVSLEQTPELKSAGCEVCHGPAGRHVETQDPGDLVGVVTIDTCEKCHTEERVSAFRYRPLVHGGAH